MELENHYGSFDVRNSKWFNSPQQDKMMDLLFKDSPIIINWNLEGMRVTTDKRIILGGMAGPSRCPSYICHEFCHMIEIQDKRMLKPMWGLTMPRQYIMGREYCNAQTCQGALREARVAALQYQFQKHIYITNSIKEIFNSFQYLPDWCYVPGKNDNERHSYLIKYGKKYLKDHDINWFFKEWKRKKKILIKKHKSSKIKLDMNEIFKSKGY